MLNTLGNESCREASPALCNQGSHRQGRSRVPKACLWTCPGSPTCRPGPSIQLGALHLPLLSTLIKSDFTVTYKRVYISNRSNSPENTRFEISRCPQCHQKFLIQMQLQAHALMGSLTDWSYTDLSKEDVMSFSTDLRKHFCLKFALLVFPE